MLDYEMRRSVDGLWDRVWSYDSWLDILGRFVEAVEQPNAPKGAPKTVIFPRFHQWDSVTRLAADAGAKGAGR